MYIKNVTQNGVLQMKKLFFIVIVLLFGIALSAIAQEADAGQNVTIDMRYDVLKFDPEKNYLN
jgi:hypothetical protein